MMVLPAFLLLFWSASAVFCMPFSLRIEKDDRLKLSWNYNAETVGFLLEAKIKPKSWLAFGFSDYGEFHHADFCVFWTDSWGRQHFTDTHTDNSSTMLPDRQQDCKLVGINHTNSGIAIKFTRKKVTCDFEDYRMEDGTTHILLAAGAGPINYLENVDLHSAATYRSMTRTTLFPPFPKPSLTPDPVLDSNVITMNVLAQRVKVPARETTYWCVIKKLNGLRDKHHIIQYEANIQEGNEDLVHHIEVFHCQAPFGKKLTAWQGDCDEPGAPEQINYCKRVIGAWAMGAPPLKYPDEAGYPIGGPNFPPWIRIEMHYNNPKSTPNRIDSSGIRFHYTPELRRYDAGCMELGLEYTPKMAIPPEMDRFQLSGHCIASCTELGLPQHGIIVFASQLHTHLTGVRVWTRHFRAGTELEEMDRDNHFNTMYQEIRTLKRPCNILPGDELITTCEFSTKNRKNATLGGYAISDEMCVNYIHYYPRTELELCKSSIDTDSLMTFFETMQNMDLDETSPNKSVIENYHSLRWTPLTASILANLYDTSPLSMQCNMSSGSRFPGEWENAPHVEISRELSPPVDECVSVP